MSNIKGTAWIAVNEYYTGLKGAEGIERIKAALSDSDRALFAKPILPITWIDYAAYMRFALTGDKILGKGDMALFKAASVYTAQKDLKGVYRMFVSLATPKFIVAGAAQLWGQYYDRGKMRAHWTGPKSGYLELTDFPDLPLHHEIDNIPWMEEALKICGCRNVVFKHTQCIAQGAPHCRIEASWE